MTRLPPGAREFICDLRTSRQSMALWYWSSSFRPVVLGATSEVMTLNHFREFWIIIDSPDSRRFFPLLVLDLRCVFLRGIFLIFSWDSLTVISPTKVVIFLNKFIDILEIDTEDSSFFANELCDDLEPATGCTSEIEGYVSSSNQSCFFLYLESLKALRARYPAAFALWNQTSWTWYPALLATRGAMIFFFHI